MRQSKFFTSPNGRKFDGRSAVFPNLKYTANTRSAALSGIKRLVKKIDRPADLSKVRFTPSKTKVTHAAIVLDRSGSMSHITEVSLKSLNDSVKQIGQLAKSQGQQANVSVYTFDGNVRQVRSSAPALGCPVVTEREVAMGGGTALYDATARAITELDAVKSLASEDPAFLLIVITDGEENASTRTSLQQLKSMMNRVQATDKFTLTFLLPPGAKARFVRATGVPEGNCAEWEATTAGVLRASGMTTNGLNSYFATRSAGGTKMDTFYSDMSNVLASTVKRTLDDLGGQVQVFQVEKEEDVKTFIEKKTRCPIILGASFYQLTKDEKKVQAYKQILIMEKGKKTVYGGSDARSLLGLPDGQDVKVKPGNHANFDIFVQSTSTNRKLVRGTKLLYMPNAAPAAQAALSTLRMAY